MPAFQSQEGADSWSPEGEAEFLDAAHGWGVESSIVRDVVQEYIGHAEGNDGEPLADHVLDSLEKRYQARGVSKEITGVVRRWARENGYV